METKSCRKGIEHRSRELVLYLLGNRETLDGCKQKSNVGIIVRKQLPQGHGDPLGLSKSVNPYPLPPIKHWDEEILILVLPGSIQRGRLINYFRLQQTLLSKVFMTLSTFFQFFRISAIRTTFFSCNNNHIVSTYQHTDCFQASKDM